MVAIDEEYFTIRLRSEHFNHADLSLPFPQK